MTGTGSDPASGRCRCRGQSTIEFALVLPTLLFLVFGAIEGSLLMFTVATVHFAAEEGSRVAAQVGNAANADTAAIQAMRSGPLGQLSLASVGHVDIYRLQQGAAGVLTIDASHYNSYRLDGSSISITWPPSARDVTSGQCDFLGLTVFYQYGWNGMVLLGSPAPLTQSFSVRLEPQTY